MDFEDLRLCDLIDKAEKRSGTIAQTRNLSEFKSLGADLQAVYDFFVTSGKPYEEQQPMLKNLFSAFNYGAVIINDAVKNKSLDKEANSLLAECLGIISACCKNIKNSLKD